LGKLNATFILSIIKNWMSFILLLFLLVNIVPWLLLFEWVNISYEFVSSSGNIGVSWFNNSCKCDMVKN